MIKTPDQCRHTTAFRLHLRTYFKTASAASVGYQEILMGRVFIMLVAEQFAGALLFFPIVKARDEKARWPEAQNQYILAACWPGADIAVKCFKR